MLLGFKDVAIEMLKWSLAPLLVLSVLTRLVFAVVRLQLHFRGDPGQLRTANGEAEFHEGHVYAAEGKTWPWPPYVQLQLPSGGTLHMPESPIDNGVAIFFLPGKGQIFNHFPLQGEMRSRGVKVDIVGLDFIAYGAGFRRNVEEHRFPRLLSEWRLVDVLRTLVEGLDATAAVYQKVLVVANSTAGLALAAALDEGWQAASVAKAVPGASSRGSRTLSRGLVSLGGLSAVQGVWLTNPVVAFRPGHIMDNLVKAPIPSWLWFVVDRVLGLGPFAVQNDSSMDWLHYIDGDPVKGFKTSMYLPGKNSGTMVALPRYQLVENTVRLHYLAEVVVACREFASRRRAGYVRVTDKPRVYYSLNFSEEEPHCGAVEAAELLSSWGAEDAGNLESHQEFVYDHQHHRAQVDKVLRVLVPHVLGVDWIQASSA